MVLDDDGEDEVDVDKLGLFEVQLGLPEINKDVDYRVSKVHVIHAGSLQLKKIMLKGVE